jgi:hypothetical protein
MARDKFFDYKAPEQMGYLAFYRAEKKFGEEEAAPTDF